MTDGLLLPFLPRWAELGIAGLLIVYFIACAAIVLSKAGRHVGWSLFLLLPGVQILMIWAFAFTKWPREK